MISIGFSICEIVQVYDYVWLYCTHVCECMPMCAYIFIFTCVGWGVNVMIEKNINKNDIIDFGGFYLFNDDLEAKVWISTAGVKYLVVHVYTHTHTCM